MVKVNKIGGLVFFGNFLFSLSHVLLLFLVELSLVLGSGFL